MKKFIDIMRQLKESKNGNVVTFDFDNTIVNSHEQIGEGGEKNYEHGGVNPYIVSLIKKFKQKGYTVFVVTSRHHAFELPNQTVAEQLEKLKIKVDGVFYTNGEKKAKKLYELGSSMHFDDDPEEHAAIVQYRMLHRDFNLIVKHPHEGLKDVSEASKGFIITSDDHYLILKRSDNQEWDVPGGHMMSGETSNYAFHRECREETGISLIRVDYLDTVDVTYNNKTMPIHYYTGRTQYNSDEISKVIDLHWENEDYFVGNLQDIIKKLDEPCTHNFKNALNLISDEQQLVEIEKYQKKVRKGHEKKKKQIIGQGNSKSTGAKGLKKVTDFTRSKSAPPGFGGLEEESKKKR